MSEVFLSYKAEDRARLKPLVAALEADGCHVWWDAHIGGGTDWREEIQDHLDAARCVIVAWSKRSVGHDGQLRPRRGSGARRERDAYLADLHRRGRAAARIWRASGDPAPGMEGRPQ